MPTLSVGGGDILHVIIKERQVTFVSFSNWMTIKTSLFLEFIYLGLNFSDQCVKMDLFIVSPIWDSFNDGGLLLNVTYGLLKNCIPL